MDGRRLFRWHPHDPNCTLTCNNTRHSSRTERTQRSAKAFALGARTGVRMIVTSSDVKTVSKVVENLVSRSWIKKRMGTSLSWIFQLI